MNLLLLLFIIFILFPLIRILFGVGKTVHQVKKAFRQQQDAFGQYQHQQSRNQETQQQSSGKAEPNLKKRAIEFLKNKSEDAEFEVISEERKPSNIDENSSKKSSKPYYTDAQYEDVK
jgi:predicted Holliday junction resolvase-like endonuclease